MQKVKCLVVDDEKYARLVLESYVNKVDGLELTASCENAIEAFNIILKGQVDLVFLDINMPQLSGVELARNISSDVKVIFTTALKEYALESYELNALDYLLKPVSFERFLKAVSKFFDSNVSGEWRKVTGLGVDVEPPASYVFLRVDRKNVKVALADILCVEGLKDYVIVRTRQENLITYLKLNYLEAKLPVDRFIRVHKSYIVALDKVRSYNHQDLELESGQEIPIGKTYSQKVSGVLDKTRL